MVELERGAEPKESVGRVSAESGLFIDGCSGWTSEVDHSKFSLPTLSLASSRGQKAILVMLPVTGPCMTAG